jgi:hypothetical protein
VFRVIEIFIRSKTLSIIQQNKNENSETISIDRQMIRYLNKCEEKLLESILWHTDSNLWTLMNDKIIKIPLYEELLFPNLNSNDSIIKPNTGFASSSLKNSPITRVLCTNSGNNNMTTKQFKVISLNDILKSKSDDTEKNMHKDGLNPFMRYFFRKFFTLANRRIRDLVDKLNLVQISIDLDKKKSAEMNNNKENPANCTPTTTLQLTPNPILTPIASSSSLIPSSPALTPISNPSINSNMNPLQAHIFNEHQNMLLKKIWSIFEYSVCLDNGRDLMKCRHIDQLILCSIYLTCRLGAIPIQFKDLLKFYKTKSEIYRQVLVSNSNETIYGDLIQFYNEIFVIKLKIFALKLNEHLLASSPISSSVSTISPAIKTANFLLLSSSLSSYQLFSPRKLDDLSQSCVFVSPCRQATTSNQQIIQSSFQNRNKLCFSLNDTSLLKVKLKFLY